MNFSILILSFVLNHLACFSQDTLVTPKIFSFSDTTLSIVHLTETSIFENLVAVENNKNTIIYIDKDSIKSFVQRKLNESDYNKNEYINILIELNRLKDRQVRDLTKIFSSSMKWVVSEQIMSGKAKIYDKQNQIYLTTAYHRLERVISTGYRTFYFSKTDRRYLYSYAEWQSIIPNELMPDIE